MACSIRYKGARKLTCALPGGCSRNERVLLFDEIQKQDHVAEGPTGGDEAIMAGKDRADVAVVAAAADDLEAN
jgi:hypothetical protein